MLKRIKGFTLIELLIVVAIIAILAAIAVPNFLEAQTRSKVARVQSDQRSLATAVESYYVDNNQYPAHDSSGATAPTSPAGFGANNISNSTTKLRNQPTFRTKKDQSDPVHTLTTPISYITSFFSDPFSDTKRATFQYSRGSNAATWIMWSFGPNTDQEGSNPVSPTLCGGDIGVAANYVVDTAYYNPPDQPHPSGSLILRTYDPTNGTTSTGDVWRAKQ